MNNIKRFVCCILAVMLIVCFTACSPNEGGNKNSEPSSEATTVAETTTATEPVTTEEKTPEIKLSESYVPKTAYDSEGAEVSVYTVYGSSFRDYGGSLCFKEDGTFTTFIGIFGNVDNESGTYKIISDTEIEMTFNNDKTVTAVVTNVDSDGNVTEIKMPHRNYDVVFALQ